MVDTSSFTDEQKKYFVQVDPMWGLTDEHAEKAVEILNSSL
jgi:hypothetical protein